MYSWINASAQLASPVVKACFSRKEEKIARLALKIPSEMEVALRYKQLTLFTLFKLFTLFTMFTMFKLCNVYAVQTALHCLNSSIYAYK